MEIKIKRQGKQWGTCGWLAANIKGVTIGANRAELELSERTRPVFLAGFFNVYNPDVNSDEELEYILHQTCEWDGWTEAAKRQCLAIAAEARKALATERQGEEVLPVTLG